MFLPCFRGWWRHQDHWQRRLDVTKQRPRGAHLNKALQDPKYRTRLCSHWENSKVRKAERTVMCAVCLLISCSTAPNPCHGRHIVLRELLMLALAESLVFTGVTTDSIVRASFRGILPPRCGRRHDNLQNPDRNYCCTFFSTQHRITGYAVSNASTRRR